MKPGGAVLDFGKVLVNREQKQSVRLKNHGSVDATVQVVVDGQGFDLLGPSSFILHPSEQRTLDVGFRLSKEGQFEGSLKVQVLRNSFEENSVKLKAVCFHQNLVPENLPGDRNDAIVLSECAIGTVKTFDFALRNMSTDMLRVQLSLLKAEGLKCSPSVCHIPPNSSKVVLLSWTPESSVNMTSVQSAFSASYRRVKMVTSASALPEDAAGEWDDRQVVVQWIRENGRPVKKVTPVPEPVVENVDTAAMDFTLPIHGVSDVASCEVSVVDIAFESTLLFGSRSKQVSVKNNGKIAIHGRAYMEFADVQMDPNTFGVTPSQFTVEPEKLLEFTVTYRPLDMLPHEGCLVFSVPGLDKQELGCRKVVLRGVASCPLVHFEVPFSSDYISSRRPAGLPGPDGIIGPLNPETRVIEIESRGVKVRNTRKFYILNPTSMSYDFRLVASALNSRSAAVRCLTTSGVVHSGKKYELVFEFVPDTLTVQEAFFTFEIVGRNYSVPFLVVGKAAEPEVLFEKGSVHFRPLLVGRKATEIVQLVNREHLPFAFAFEGLDSSKSITVAPASGLVPPESQQSIEVTFAPDVEDSYNVNLSCFVKKKPSALNLNIKGDAYMVKDSLMMVDVDGSVSEIYPSTANSVDLGRIYVGQRLERQFRIVNSGRHPFDYSWGGSSSRHLTIAPAEGTVAKGESKNITVAFHPSVETRLDHLKTVCKVANGHQFVVELNAVAARPALRFSFFAFDFGQCFVYHPASQASSVDLLVQNDDMVDISFDVLFENLPHLEVKASPTVLKPGHSQVITISFFPREARSYHEVIPIEINGLTTVNIAIDGEGTLPRLELVNPAQQSVAFGSVRVGESVTKTISIVNKSRIASRLLLEDASLKDSYISIAPREVLLRPQQVLDLTVCFAPLSRLRAFKNVSVPLTVGGIPFSLFSLSGVAQGLEVKLDPSILSFGAVVENAAAIQKVIVENSGDVGFAYRFIHTEGTREFLVNPSEGFVAAHTDGVVEVSFSPLPLTTGSPEERTAKFVFAIEGGSPPSTLCCSGTCVARPPAQETVKFATSVRSTASKKVTIKNPTKMDWLLRPIIDHDFWKGSSPTLQVAANSSGTYELNFLPLTMTSQQSGPHKGSMFVPCPDGSALLFLLEGEASAPVPENNGASGPVTVPAKSLYVHSLTVKNWLKTPQRFQVLMELQKHDTTTVKGLDYIDVPGSLSRDYKLTIYPYVESSTTGKITFRNIETQEYAFFNINFVHSAPRPLANIALEAHVRQSAFYTIRIDNPLTEDVTLSCSCSSMSLSLPSQSVIAKGMQESAFVVTYFPLVAGTEKDVKFELKSDKLGSFPYLFTLNAHAASSERSYHFEVPLGSSSSQTIRFISYVKQAVDYAVELTGDGGDFETSAKTVKANAAVSGSREGVEVSFPVMFTPRMLGASRSNVRVFHATGGEYLFTLTGSCVPPRPQGPFEIKANQSISIPFTNVFRDNAVFNIVVDNSAFVVKPSETVPAGKAIQIAVQFKPLGAVTAPVVSKLVVTNDRSPPWVFYLKGTN
jgi:hydrocephalus-inducing protein